jgi:hypothetical protein
MTFDPEREIAEVGVRKGKSGSRRERRKEWN